MTCQEELGSQSKCDWNANSLTYWWCVAGKVICLVRASTSPSKMEAAATSVGIVKTKWPPVVQICFRCPHCLQPRSAVSLVSPRHHRGPKEPPARCVAFSLALEEPEPGSRTVSRRQKRKPARNWLGWDFCFRASWNWQFPLTSFWPIYKDIKEKKKERKDTIYSNTEK